MISELEMYLLTLNSEDMGLYDAVFIYILTRVITHVVQSQVTDVQ